MPNVRDIAKHAGVSVGTVSRVLNNKPHVSPSARAKVMQAAHRTRVAVPAVGRVGTSCLALVYRGPSSLDSAFDGAVIQGISEALNETDYQLMIVNAGRGRGAGESLGQMLLRRGVAGALLRTTLQTHDMCDELAEDGFPAVAIADEIDHPSVGCVFSDATEAIDRALEHLAHLGHRKIAIALNTVDDHDHAQRLDHYRRFVAGRGLTMDERWVVRSPARHVDGGAALRQLMALPDRPTAVFATDPALASGICAEALRLGIRLPEQLSLVGFDDTEDRYGTYPRMSAVCQDTQTLGREAVKLLLARMDPRGVPGRVALRCWFEPLDSTAAPSDAPVS